MRIRRIAAPPRNQTRRGTVTVEFALAAPILFMVIFAGIEFSRVNTIRNTVDNAAFDGARKGIVSGATAAQCRTEAELLLNALDLKGYTVTVTPAKISPTTTDVTVTIAVPLGTENLLLTPRFVLGSTLTRSVTLQRDVSM